MDYCKMCDSFPEEGINKDGFCPACVDALKRAEKIDKKADKKVKEVKEETSSE